MEYPEAKHSRRTEGYSRKKSNRICAFVSGRPNFRLSQEKIAELNAVLQDNFSGIKEIQVFNKQE